MYLNFKDYQYNLLKLKMNMILGLKFGDEEPNLQIEIANLVFLC